MKAVPPTAYTKKYFLTDCEGWDHFQKFEKQKLSPRLSHAASLLSHPAGKTILDFGCGRGELSAFLLKKKAKLIAVDYSPEALKLTRETIATLPSSLQKNIKIINASAKTLTLPHQSLDAIFFLDVFEHLTNQELDKLLSRFHLWLKPNGQLIIHTAPNRLFLLYGYPYFTRFLNLASNPIWKLIFKEKRITRPCLKSPSDHLVHINEQTPNTLKTHLNKHHFKAKVWLDSSYQMIRLRDKIHYRLCQPLWLPYFNRFFHTDIWAIAQKNTVN